MITRGPRRLRDLGDGVALAIVGGSVAGYLDVLALAIRRRAIEPLVFVGEHVVWTSPLANVVLALIVVAATGMMAIAMRRASLWLVSTWLLTWLSLFGALYTFPQIHRVAAVVLAAGIATLTTRWVKTREVSVRRGLRPVSALLVLVTGALAIRMLSRERLQARATVAALPAAREGATNVLLIVLDTVRAMNLSLYGYGRETTPHLARWATRGVSFTSAYSTAPWTLSSHASMLTGRWMHELSADWMVPLDDTYPTLGEVLSRAGYRTGGFVANTDYCSAEVGLDRGFGHFEDYTLAPGQILRSSALWRALARFEPLRRIIGDYDNLGRKTAPEISAAFLRWRDQDRRRPFFAMLNYYDAHRPYLPPGAWAHRFSSPGVRPHPRYRKENGTDPNPSADRIQGAIDAYDNAIAYLDSEVGRLLDELAERGDIGRTVIIITSDHGEEFFEHGVWDHGNSLYGPSVRVPLVVLLPGEVAAGRVVSTPVTLRDLPATVLDLIAPGDSAPFPGRSLAVDWSGPVDTRSPEPVLIGVRQVPRQPVEYPVTRGNLASVVIGELRYLRNLGDNREEVYHQIDDPIERRNLIDHPEVLGLLPTFRAITDSFFVHRP